VTRSLTSGSDTCCSVLFRKYLHKQGIDLGVANSEVLRRRTLIRASFYRRRDQLRRGRRPKITRSYQGFQLILQEANSWCLNSNVYQGRPKYHEVVSRQAVLLSEAIRDSGSSKNSSPPTNALAHTDGLCNVRTQNDKYVCTVVLASSSQQEKADYK
jgi:hypothetical protein